MSELGKYEAFPLCWPVGKPRTKNPQSSNFRANFGSARDGIVRQIRNLNGRNPIISTNIPLRRDGLPYAQTARPDDCGVAVYFVLKNHQMCFACDRWNSVVDNIRAIEKTIDALRGIERWGTGDMVERAFTGFAALPAPQAPVNWRHVLGFKDADAPSDAEVSEVYHVLRKKQHPDHGGSAEQFIKVQEAYRLAREEIGVSNEPA